MRLTKKINDRPTRVRIIPATKEDYEWIEESRQYLFDWRLEQFSEVYKFIIESVPDQVQGIMSLDNYQKQERLNINQIEISKPNRGNDRSIEGVAGCLIAYAARRSIILGYDGVITLEPKYQLVNHYRLAYGFEDFGGFMMLSTTEASNLIKKYLEDE